MVAADRSIGHAEAMRRSMLAMIETGDPHEAHPSYWAPFVVVGEGRALDAPSAEVNAPVVPVVVPPAPASKTARKAYPKDGSSWQQDIWNRR
jgi:hypothetical protein